MSVNIKIEEILNGTVNLIKIPSKYGRKLRSRLRKRLKFEITRRLENESMEKISSEITAELRERYTQLKIDTGDYDHLSECTTPTVTKSLTNSDTTDVDARDADDDIDEENRALCNLPCTEFLDIKKDALKLSRDNVQSKAPTILTSQDNAYLVKENRSLVELTDMLKERIERQKNIIQRAKIVNSNVMMNNRTLGYRSRELARRKMAPYFSPRTVNIVDSSIYSDFFGYLDGVILDIPITVVKFANVYPDKSNFFVAGNFRQIHKGYLKNGEAIVLKRVKPSISFSDEKCLSILSVQIKIAKLVGKHPNIADYLGLFMHSTTSYIVQMYESPLNLRQYLSARRKLNKGFVLWFIKGLSDGILHTYSKGILNNNLTPKNIVLKLSCQYYTPIITSFSLACREESARPLTILQQNIYKDCYHLPNCVLRGSKAPSFSSDIFSFGHIIRALGKVNESEIDLHMRCLSYECIGMHTITTASEFETFIDKFCNLIDE